MERDDLFEDAAILVVKEQTASSSLLQRNLKLGYMRAWRIIDQLCEAKIIGAENGVGMPREVLVKDIHELNQLVNTKLP